jgi:predicted nucleotide-binding protein
MPSHIFQLVDRRYLAMALSAAMSHGDLSLYEMGYGLSTEGVNKASRATAIVKHIFEDELESDRLIIDLLNRLYVTSANAGYRMMDDSFQELQTIVLDRIGIERTGNGYEMPAANLGGSVSTPTAGDRFTAPAPPVDRLVLPRRQDIPTPPDARKRVVVIYGQDDAARTAMFTFLRSLHLEPLEFEQIVNETGQGSPFTGAAIDLAFTRAQAIITLITPDEWAALHPDLGAPTRRLQARPNVIFEAGLAFGRLPNRTIIVKYGNTELWSDMDGRHYIDIDNSGRRRQALRDRLEHAGCPIANVGSDYLTSPAGGDFATINRAS